MCFRAFCVTFCSVTLEAGFQPALHNLLVAVDFPHVGNTEISRKHFFCFSHPVLSRLCIGKLCALHGEMAFRFQLEPKET